MSEREERLKSALISMCDQYLGAPNGEYHHGFMSAGEEATDVLAELYPDEFEPTPRGCRQVTEQPEGGR